MYFSGKLIKQAKNPGKHMQPRAKEKQAQMEMFERELEGLVNPAHPLVKPGRLIDWTQFEKKPGAKYHARIGAPGVNTRLMVALHYLKCQHDPSDGAVVAQWVENAYWQHFSGEQSFQSEMPIDPTSMTRWRRRLGEEGAELMLRQTIDTGVKMKAIKPAQIKRVNIDTTVQTKAIRYPRRHCVRSPLQAPSASFISVSSTSCTVFCRKFFNASSFSNSASICSRAASFPFIFSFGRFMVFALWLVVFIFTQPLTMSRLFAELFAHYLLAKWPVAV
jgi:hypothetical protein